MHDLEDDHDWFTMVALLSLINIHINEVLLTVSKRFFVVLYNLAGYIKLNLTKLWVLKMQGKCFLLFWLQFTHIMNSLGTSHRPQLTDTGLVDKYECFRETIYQPLQKMLNKKKGISCGDMTPSILYLSTRRWRWRRSASHPTCFDPEGTDTSTHRTEWLRWPSG
jgi:hypothetical protein